MAAKETKKPEAAISVRDSRWWPLLKVYIGLIPQFGSVTDLEVLEALERGETYCARRLPNSSRCTKVEASFWPSLWFDEDSLYCGRLDIYGSDSVMSPYRTILGTWVPPFDGREFYVWEPEKVWPTLDARKGKPRKPRKALGTDSVIEASAAASGAAEAGDTAAVRPKRKRRGKLTAEQITRGRAYLCDHPGLTRKQAYPELRRVMKSAVSNSTLWRTFPRSRPRHFI
jgi:hypothetical protein